MQINIRGQAVHVDLGIAWGPSDLRNRVATAHFVYEAHQNPSITFTPTEGDEVRVIDDDGVTTLFTGHIAMVKRGGDPVYRQYDITCQDLNYLFDKIVTVTNLSSGSAFPDSLQVFDLLTGGNVYTINGQTFTVSVADAIGIQSYNIGNAMMNCPGSTIAAGTSIRAALDTIASKVGRPIAWFLDAQRVFHWNDQGALAPFALSTRPNISGTTYMDGYEEFIDHSTAYQQVTVNGSGGLTATAIDLVAYGDAITVYRREADRPPGPTLAARLGSAPVVSDASLTTQAQVTARAWAELEKGKVRRTIRCRVFKPGLRAGMLIDVIHDVWGTADLIPAAGIDRSPSAHSSLKGELAVGARGRYLIQKVTPRVAAQGATTLQAFDLELGDYEAGLDATLARSL